MTIKINNKLKSYNITIKPGKKYLVKHYIQNIIKEFHDVLPNFILIYFLHQPLW